MKGRQVGMDGVGARARRRAHPSLRGADAVGDAAIAPLTGPHPAPESPYRNTSRSRATTIAPGYSARSAAYPRSGPGPAGGW